VVEASATAPAHPSLKGRAIIVTGGSRGLGRAMVLGLAQQIGFRLDPGWGIWFGHLVFLAVLVVRPQGLFPRTRG